MEDTCTGQLWQKEVVKKGYPEKRHELLLIDELVLEVAGKHG